MSRAPVGGVHIGGNPHIADVSPRHAVEHHIARDAAHAPHILALQIAAVAPAHKLHSHRVASLDKVARDVPLRRCLRVLTVAHLAAVDIEVYGTTGGAELDYRTSTLPAGRNREMTHIDTRGVVVAWSPRRVAAELVAHIDIYGYSICGAVRSLLSRSALQFYVSGHHDAVPLLGRECGLLRSIIDAERPPSVEAHGPWPVGDIAVVRLHLVQPVHLQIVPIRLRLYADNSEKRHYYANGEKVLAHIQLQKYTFFP